MVNATDEDLDPQPLIPSMYKMIAIVIIQSGYD